ncbi:hypothetical protein BU062_11465 [Staphylococcus succinus]|uniref:hypothetical protein n=1 Tax=Staphylococcus succinus TaxID=61015 RepID=UPI000D1E3D26|nr:hypothetical protein [Staphylococcus succinus]PTI39323.1 hypothetical protein BU062_11465 [Staphylococcus succinus]
MQSYLNDGHEVLEIMFDEIEVQTYNHLFKLQPSTMVPSLFCARLWSKFQLFQPFLRQNILLRETKIDQRATVHINEKYNAHMFFLGKQKVRQFMKYTFRLEINKNKENCISITQIFLEDISNDANYPL